VIDLRTIRPLDLATIITSVKKTNRLVVVDENFPYGSIAAKSPSACSAMPSTTSTHL
jgi:pyruvate dehydrogenase E1 component beta subunit